ncbi:MAG: CAP domain-containing protein [Granulosicoccus sp.]
MKKGSPIVQQSMTWIGPAVKLKLLVSAVILNVACGTADPMATPPLSSAEPEESIESPFTPVASSEENPANTPAEAETPESEPIVTIVPVITVVEPDSEPNGNPTPGQTTINTATCSSSESEMQQRMLQLINDARATARVCGTDSYPATRSLSWNTNLAEASRVHSDDMATHNFFDHTGSDGSSAAMRVTRQGYQWRAVGENIAAGRTTAEATVNDWLESPGHCRNIMNPTFAEVAVACVEDSDSDFGRYWTNVLATPL